MHVWVPTELHVREAGGIWPMGCSLPSTDLSSSLDTRPSIHYQTSPGHLLCARLWARKGLGAESLVGEAEVHPHGHDVGQRVWW